jgi:hypothetical protein
MYFSGSQSCPPLQIKGKGNVDKHIELTGVAPGH